MKHANVKKGVKIHCHASNMGDCTPIVSHMEHCELLVKEKSHTLPSCRPRNLPWAKTKVDKTESKATQRESHSHAKQDKKITSYGF